MNIDDVISYYEGKVVRDRKRILTASPISEGVPRAVYEKELKWHKLVLCALKCAKANGFTGEE